MRHPLNPFELCALALRHQALMIASAQTIWWRAGLMMTGAMTPIEATTMCMEKPEAIARAMHQGARAANRGQSPARVMSATLKPISARASSNARRLRR